MLLLLAQIANAKSQAYVAIERAEQALLRFKAVDDSVGQGSALSVLGNAYIRLGKFQDASRSFEGALELAHRVGDRRAEMHALTGLGNAMVVPGDFARAEKVYDRGARNCTRPG